jgi:hypothetical protein
VRYRCGTSHEGCAWSKPNPAGACVEAWQWGADGRLSDPVSVGVWRSIQVAGTTAGGKCRAPSAAPGAAPQCADAGRAAKLDRLVFLWVYRIFPSVLNATAIVKPETVLRWHRGGFRAYWRWKSWRRGGRPRIDRGLRARIRRMSPENPLWGAPRIHGELLMMGIDVSESTVARYMVSTRHAPLQGWKTYLRNHAAGTFRSS